MNVITFEFILVALSYFYCFGIIENTLI